MSGGIGDNVEHDHDANVLFWLCVVQSTKCSRTRLRRCMPSLRYDICIFSADALHHFCWRIGLNAGIADLGLMTENTHPGTISGPPGQAGSMIMLESGTRDMKGQETGFRDCRW